MASAAELRKLVSEFATRAKTFNVTALAVSALVKKLAIINFQIENIAEKEIVEFTKTQLELRFQRLLGDLMEARSKIIEEDFICKLEIELFRLKMDFDIATEVEESDVVVYETCLEISNDVKRMVTMDIPEIVNWCRNRCLSGNMSKLVDISSFLETHFERKLHLQIFIV
jgi:hypothetical protein